MEKNWKKIISVLAVGLISCVLISQEAQANTINGTIAFYGTASATVGSTTTITPYSPWVALGGTGDYFGVTGAPAVFNSITYTGTGTGATLSSAVLPLWTFTLGGKVYSFDLESLTSGTTDIIGGMPSVALSGTGTAHITGFQDTFATWSLSGTGPSSTLTFDFSTATAGGTAVPDGGLTIGLLGFALAGVEGFRRKLK